MRAGGSFTPPDPRSKQLLLAGARGGDVPRSAPAEVLVGAAGRDPAAGRAVDEADLQQVRLIDVLDRVGLLADGRREGADADRPSPELVDDGEEQLAVHLVEA